MITGNFDNMVSLAITYAPNDKMRNNGFLIDIEMGKSDPKRIF